MVYSFLSSFIMIYLTNIVGLNAGIVGTLIAVSKLFDGVTDIFFGAMIDKTKSRLGKARPWMLYAYIGCAVTLIANFAIPTNMGKFAQYAWFFIAYTLLNAVFFTASVVTNLIDNAVKASRKESKIVLEATPDHLMVQDFGKGIPKEDLEMVTEPFYMVDKSRSRAKGSVGLGLSLCQKIIELHDFHLKIESNPGKGTTVSVFW